MTSTFGRLAAVASLVAVCLQPGLAASVTKPAPEQLYASKVPAAQTRTQAQPKKRYSFSSTHERVVDQLAQGWRAKGGASSTPVPADATPLDVATPNINFPGFLQSDAYVSTVSSDITTQTFQSLTVDVNKDGLADLVTLQLDGTLNVLVNPGAGNVAKLAVTYSNNKARNEFEPYIRYARAADLNGDGYPDIVGVDYLNTAALIFINKKDGTFADPVSFPLTFPSGNTYWGQYFLGGGGDIVVGDVNNDGIADIVATLFSPDVNDLGSSIVDQVTYLGKSDGTFGTAVAQQSVTLTGSATGTAAGEALLADIDKDGNPDLVFLASTIDFTPVTETFITVLKGDGSGHFSALPTTLPTTGAVLSGTSLVDVSLAAQDVDGDGNLDVLIGSGSVYLVPGNGDGTLGTPTEVLGGLPYLSAVNFADIDGDGLPDIVDYFDCGIRVYSNLGKGTFAQTPSIQLVAGEGSNQQPVPADFDGDGKPDLAEVDADLNMAAVFLQKSGVFYSPTLLVPLDEPVSDTELIATGDANGDGAPDVLFIDYGASSQNEYGAPDVKIAVNDGKGNFTYVAAIPGETVGNNLISEGLNVFADLNGDGRGDILTTTFDNKLLLSLSKADGTYSDPTQINLFAACAPGVAAAGDLNNDGKTDLVLAYPGDSSCSGSNSLPSGVFILLGNGDGTFKTSFIANGTQDWWPVLVDYNGDGKVDLGILDSFIYGSNSSVWIIPGNGDGTFDVGNIQQAFTGVHAISIIPGDFNSDGKQDLTVSLWNPAGGPESTGIYQIPGNGDFTFGIAQSYGIGTIAFDGSYTDFNGDGLPDLILNLGVPDPYYRPGYFRGSLMYMANVGTGYTNPIQVMSGAGDDPEGTVNVADFNGDGSPDVVNDGQVGIGVYLNQGAAVFTLAASETDATQADSVTLTATLKPTVSLKTPTGTVSFFNNGTLLSVTPVSGNTATLTLNNLPVGSNAITATYSGDANFNGESASTGVTVAVAPLPPSFSLGTPSSTSITLAQGGTSTLTLPIIANATFSGAVTLTCSGAPAAASCTVAPGSVTLSGGQTATAAVVIATTVKNNKQSAENVVPAWLKGAGGVSMAGLVLAMLPGRRRRMRGIWMVLLLAVTGAVATLSLSGCGDDGAKYPGTPLGTTTLTVTATSGSVSQTQTISLTVN